MNEQMTVWLIIVGVFFLALVFRIIERVKELKVKDNLFLEEEDYELISYRNNEYDDSDEFGDL